MNFFGKPSIHPFLFYSGKIYGYILWLIYLLSILRIFPVIRIQITIFRVFSYIMSLAGLIIIVISCINLGNSNRLGLPVGNTKLKVTGLYKLSRNPMYLGFNLLTISSVIFTLNIVTALMGIYSILIYHFIILAEEKFLEERFGSEYIEYKKRVGRYI